MSQVSKAEAGHKNDAVQNKKMLTSPREQTEQTEENWFLKFKLKFWISRRKQNWGKSLGVLLKELYCDSLTDRSLKVESWSSSGIRLTSSF